MKKFLLGFFIIIVILVLLVIILNPEFMDLEKKKSDFPANLLKECLNYNITSDTIIFFYMDEPHSNAMKPIVSELSKYKFYWQDNVTDFLFKTCFGYNEGTIPAFVCAGTGKKILGETSKQNLEAFAKECRG